LAYVTYFKKSDKIWRIAAFNRFPKMQDFDMAYDHIHDWRKWLSLRLNVMSGSTTDPIQQVFIENCYSWELLCPVAVRQLEYRDDKTDFCKVCNKEVHIVTKPLELYAKVSEGACIAIDFEGKYTNDRNDAHEVRRGGVRRHRPKGLLERLGF